MSLIASGLLVAALNFLGAGGAPGGVGSEEAQWVTSIEPIEAAALLDNQGVIVLDIRTPEEFAQGHVRGATNIDFKAQDFVDRLDQLDRNRTYLLHCASGGRSSESLVAFQELGFRSIVHMDGGMKAWIRSGQIVAK